MSASPLALEVLELLRLNPGLPVKQAIDTRDMTALQNALAPVKAVALLRPADPANRQFYTRQTRHGRAVNIWQSPLEYAVRQGTYEQAALLLAHGARITPSTLNALCERLGAGHAGFLGTTPDEYVRTEAFQISCRLVVLFDQAQADWSIRLPAGAGGVSAQGVSVYERMVELIGGTRVQALGVTAPACPHKPIHIVAQRRTATRP